MMKPILFTRICLAAGVIGTCHADSPYLINRAVSIGADYSRAPQADGSSVENYSPRFDLTYRLSRRDHQLGNFDRNLFWAGLNFEGDILQEDSNDQDATDTKVTDVQRLSLYVGAFLPLGVDGFESQLFDVGAESSYIIQPGLMIQGATYNPVEGAVGEGGSQWTVGYEFRGFDKQKFKGLGTSPVSDQTSLASALVANATLGVYYDRFTGFEDTERYRVMAELRLPFGDAQTMLRVDAEVLEENRRATIGLYRQVSFSELSELNPLNFIFGTD